MARKITQAPALALPVATPGAPSVSNGGTPGVQTWGYKIVGLDANGNPTDASVEGTTLTGAATLNGTDFNTITWTDPANAVKVAIYRTTSGGTPSTTGLIGTVLAGVQTFDDTGLVANGADAPATNTTGRSTVLDVKAFQQITTFVDGLTGTWKIQVSADGSNFYAFGSTQTNSTYLDCTVQVNFMRIDIVTYTSGTPTCEAICLYSHEGG